MSSIRSNKSNIRHSVVNACSIRVAIILAIFGFNSTCVNAQNRCDCGDNFENLLSKINDNYIAYALTKKTIESDYQQQIAKYRELVKTASDENCASVLQSFLSFFKDGHLFVSEIPVYSDEELSKFKESVVRKKMDLDKVYQYLLDNQGRLSAEEGLWTDGKSNFAVIKNAGSAGESDLLAIILKHEQADKVGEIKFRVSTRENSFEGTYYSNAYAPRFVTIRALKNNTLLSIWGGSYWGRIAFTDLLSIKNARPSNPIMPSVSKTDAETAVLTVPSFLIDKKDLDKVLEENEMILKSARFLIIDIRGNNGGNGIYFDLMRYYVTRPASSEVGLALSSADNIKYFEKFSGGRTNNLYGQVANEMKDNPGKIVSGPKYDVIELRPLKSDIERVAILTDGANVSAAESFIMYSKKVSDKVITIGKNTRGVIDYQSINMVKLGCDKPGLHFGYPTSSAHKNLPEGGINNIGLKPDVFSELEGNELVVFATEYLKDGH
jgi:hypothetical protein